VIATMRAQPRRFLMLSGFLVLAALLAVFASISQVAKAATPSAHYISYSVTPNTGNTQGITVDQFGNPWFSAGPGTIGTINHTSGKLTVYTLANPNAFPGSVKIDEAGNVWFTEFTGPAIAELNPVTGQEHEFAIPVASQGGAVGPDFLEIDGQGNKWFNVVDFTDATGGFVGRLTPAGVMTLWAVPTAGAELEEINLDPFGNLWFAEQNTNIVGKLNPFANAITEYTSPTPNSRPAGVLAAPDGTIWFSEHDVNKIAHLFPNKARGVTTHVTPTVSRSGPAITPQPAAPGNPTNPTKTTEPGSSASTPTTLSQGFVEYTVPGQVFFKGIEDMRFDRSGNIFFENDTAHVIGELVFATAHPFVNEWAIPNGVGYFNIEFDACGTLWISDIGSSTVYKFTLDS
jgi:streptogramin lyase